MSSFVLVPEKMIPFLVRVVKQQHPGAESVLMVLKQQPIKIPVEYEFVTDDGDHCRTIAWSEKEAREQVNQDRRFPGPLHFQSSHLAWPGTGVVRIICTDYIEEGEEK